MSDGGFFLVVMLATIAVLWVIGKFIVGPILSKGLDVAEHVTKSVAGKAKEVTAIAGHAVSIASLRVQTQKFVKTGLEVADQTTGANELGLDADLSRKNDELAERIVRRTVDGLGELPSGLPQPALLATYGLLRVASELSVGEMREKTRIAGQAIAQLVNKAAAENDHFSRDLMSASASFMAQLDSEALIEAMEKA